MKLTIGSDHRGYRVKQKIVDYLNRNGHQCHDVGTNSDQSVDYPDIAQAVSRDVCTGDSKLARVINLRQKLPINLRPFYPQKHQRPRCSPNFHNHP